MPSKPSVEYDHPYTEGKLTIETVATVAELRALCAAATDVDTRVRLSSR
jgi:hypothetical protein